MSSVLRVLVVEDNEDCLATMTELLLMDGCSVRGAPDCDSALLVAAAWQPHIVLLDLGLPKVNGFEVALKLRQMQIPVQPFIAAVTGWDSPQHRATAASCGIDAYFVKPVRWTELGALLDQAAHKG